MGISNIASNLRPGICTSSTRPTTPYEGQVIYETDTNRVLVWDNAAWVMIADTDQPPGLQLVKTQTIGTAVSSVTVSDAFSADYETYKIVISGGAGSGTADLRFKLGTTATNYRYVLLYSVYNAANNTSYTLNSNSATSFAYAGSFSSTAINLTCEVTNPQLAKNTIFSSNYVSPIAGGYAVGPFGGFLEDTTQYTSFTIETSAGTLTGGTIRVYGYRN